jgi:hypothetical protein
MSKRLNLEPHERKAMIEFIAAREVAQAEFKCSESIFRARHAAAEFFALTITKAHHLDASKYTISEDLECFVERKPSKVKPINEPTGNEAKATESSTEEAGQASATG